MIAGGAVSRVHPDDAGLHPGWRSAVMEVVAGIDWSEGTSATQIESLRTYLKSQTDLLAQLSSFTYFNEVSLMKSRRKVTHNDYSIVGIPVRAAMAGNILWFSLQ
jgi:hypothetical protein